MELFDESMVIMQKSMDLRMANQHLIASNLANLDTPGFVAQRLDFVLDTVQARCDDGGVEEMLVGIAAGDAVFEAHGFAVAGDAERGGSIVAAPGDGVGREG